MKLFHKPTVADLASQQLYEARRNLLLEHAAAEHHSARVTMLQSRIKRLESQIDRENSPLLHSIVKEFK